MEAIWSINVGASAKSFIYMLFRTRGLQKQAAHNNVYIKSEGKYHI
jgi:hypothetical protein